MTTIRSVTQSRPRGSDGPSYSPQRDLAYIYAPAMREALWALDKANWSPEIKELCDRSGIGEPQISLAVQSLMDGHRRFLTMSYSSAEEALRAAGWYDHSAVVRCLIYSRLGEVMLGGFFIALRDVTPVGGMPPTVTDLMEMLAAGSMLVDAETGKREMTPSVLEAAMLRAGAAEESKKLANQAMREAADEHVEATRKLRANQVTEASLWQLVREGAARCHPRRMLRLATKWLTAKKPKRLSK